MSRAPVVPKRPSSYELFGEQFVDDYAWLRERDDPEVRALLEAESAHTEATLALRTEDLRARLYTELRGRIREDDSSVPSRDGPWLYYSRTELGDEYPRHCRRAHEHAPEQLYLDENALAEDHDYFDLACIALSPDHRLCAYSFDADGDEVYEVRVLDLETGELLVDRLRGCGRTLAWADGGVLFYLRLDATHRPWQVWRHRLGTSNEDDVCVWEEQDGKFYATVYRSRSDAFVCISLDSAVSSEVWLIPTNDPTAAPQCVAPRREKVEYGVAHWRGRDGEARLFVVTNDGAQNFAVELLEPANPREGMAVPAGMRKKTFIAHREHVLIEEIDAFAGHLIVWERCDGLPRVRVIPLEPWPESAGDDDHPAPGEHLIAFDEPTYSVWPESNPEFDSTTLRFGYSSLTTPDSIFDYDLRTHERTLRKRNVVVGGHDPERYGCARVWASAGDGERVPISLVWRKDLWTDEPSQLVLDGYGAYGVVQDPSFSSARLSLLDRGVVFAIAHVRGGGLLGRRWYEAGKLAHKHNSFTDFIACAEHLIAEGWTSPAQLAATGGSAGGLLVGAVANMRPDLFTALALDVPFVDTLNTMLDPNLPLSLIERDEWGDPSTPEGFAWIRAYSPYENIRAQAYPDMLVLAGFNDTRVGYWEPAKWVARLRERKLDAREILLWVNMDAGHAGPSGRFEFLHELALEYAFLLDRLGLARPR